MVASEKIFPALECDRFRCELLGISFVLPPVTRGEIISPPSKFNRTHPCMETGIFWHKSIWE